MQGSPVDDDPRRSGPVGHDRPAGQPAALLPPDDDEPDDEPEDGEDDDADEEELEDVEDDEESLEDEEDSDDFPADSFAEPFDEPLAAAARLSVR
jgi:hypothetical protein